MTLSIDRLQLCTLLFLTLVATASLFSPAATAQQTAPAPSPAVEPASIDNTELSREIAEAMPILKEIDRRMAVSQAATERDSLKLNVTIGKLTARRELLIHDIRLLKLDCQNAKSDMDELQSMGIERNEQYTFARNRFEQLEAQIKRLNAYLESTQSELAKTQTQYRNSLAKARFQGQPTDIDTRIEFWDDVFQAPEKTESTYLEKEPNP